MSDWLFLGVVLHADEVQEEHNYLGRCFLEDIVAGEVEQDGSGDFDEGRRLFPELVDDFEGVLGDREQ